MQNRFAIALSWLLLAPSAAADPIVELRWTATTDTSGDSVPGGSDLAAAQGAVVTLGLFLSDTANGISAASISLQWNPVLVALAAVECPDATSDPPGGNLLPGVCTPDPSPPFPSPLFPGVTLEPGSAIGFDVALPTNDPSFGEIELGAISFLVGNNGTGLDVFYRSGIDGVVDGHDDTFTPAASATLSVTDNVIPEPSTGLLLAASLAALGGVVRSRRGTRSRGLLRRR